MVSKKQIRDVMKELGKRGGKVKSEAKTAAVKKNASLGGLARANKYKQKRISDNPAALTESGAESVQPEKLNTADKSGASPELLPAQLDPISKHSLAPELLSTQRDTHTEKK